MHNSAYLHNLLIAAVRDGDGTPATLTTARDVRGFLGTLVDELVERTPTPLGTDVLAALAGTAGTPSATNTFVTDADPRLAATATATPDGVEQVAAPVGQDYFYYVLADRYHLAEATGVRNVQAFAYQLVQGPNAWPIQPTLDGLNANIDQLTLNDVRGGYTIGVQLLRADATQPAFARLRLKAVV